MGRDMGEAPGLDRSDECASSIPNACNLSLRSVHRAGVGKSAANVLLSSGITANTDPRRFAEPSSPMGSWLSLARGGSAFIASGLARPAGSARDYVFVENRKQIRVMNDRHMLKRQGAASPPRAGSTLGEAP
jgi:hypothetical protein